ncbi:hypothetical protein BD410DRAFT_683936, partial [Rickenella mellea]
PSSPSESPTQTFHPALVPNPIPTPALLGSAAGGAHYSGAKMHHRHSDIARASFSSGGSPVELEGRRKKVMDDVRELFECRPTIEIFQRSWSKDAEFEDPLSHCKGLDEVVPQVRNVFPKIFSKSTTVSNRVMQSHYDPNRIVFAQTQEYTFKLIGLKKTIKSMVVVDLDDEERIVKLSDLWNGESPPINWGTYRLRRLNARVTPWLVKVPK